MGLGGLALHRRRALGQRGDTRVPTPTAPAFPHGASGAATRGGAAPDDLPTAFDAREAWPECSSIRRVRNQGECGSCYAHGAAEALSDRFCIASRGEHTPSLAVQWALDCDPHDAG